MVPGPDVIGRLEDNVTELRTRFVRRDGLIQRIREQRGDMMPGDSGSNGNGDESSGDGSNPAKDRGDRMV